MAAAGGSFEAACSIAGDSFVNSPPKKLGGASIPLDSGGGITLGRAGTVLVRVAGFVGLGNADLVVGVGVVDGRCGTVLVRDAVFAGLGVTDLDIVVGVVDGRCGTVLVRDVVGCCATALGTTFGTTLVPPTVPGANFDFSGNFSGDFSSDSSGESQSESKSSVLGTADEALGVIMVALDADDSGGRHQRVSIGQGERDVAN